jgi:hypothetical protein
MLKSGVDLHKHDERQKTFSDCGRLSFMTRRDTKLRMTSSGMLRCVDLVRTDVSEERSASIIRVTRIGELGTKLAVTSNRRTLRRNGIIRRNIPEDAILNSHLSEKTQILHRCSVEIHRAAKTAQSV